MGIKLNVAAAAVLAATLATQSSGTSSLVATSAAPAGFVALEGNLPTGKELRQATAYTLDDDAKIKLGDSLKRTEVTSAVSHKGRSYSISIDPRNVPASAIDATGTVDLEIHLASADTVWVTYASARLVDVVSTNSREWIDPLIELPASSRSRGQSVARIQTRAKFKQAEVGQGQLAKSTRALETNRGDIELMHFCGEYTYRKQSNRKATVSTSYPVGISKSWVEVENSSGGSFGVATRLEAGGSFHVGGTRSVSGGWGGRWDPSSAQRSYQVVTNYHYYQNACGQGYWAPHIETGGAGTTTGITRPTWNKYCAPQPDNYTFWRKDSTAHAYSWGSAVKFKDVIGLDLSGSKQYSSHHMLAYRIDGRPKKLCGNNDFPSKASKIVERLR